MDGWQIAGTVMAVWFAGNILFASGLIAYDWRKARKPAPQPPLSDAAVDALFAAIVQETQARDESTGGAS